MLIKCILGLVTKTTYTVGKPFLYSGLSPTVSYLVVRHKTTRHFIPKFIYSLIESGMHTDTSHQACATCKHEDAIKPHDTSYQNSSTV